MPDMNPIEWLVDNGTTPLFTHSDVVDMEEVPGQTLQNWANRGLVAPTVEAAGRQTKRLYSPVNLVTIALGQQLIALGLGSATALSFGLCAWKAWLAQLSDDLSVGKERRWSDIVEAVAFLRGNHPTPESGVSVHSLARLPVDDLYNSEPTIFFPFGPTVHGVATRAMERAALNAALDEKARVLAREGARARA